MNTKFEIGDKVICMHGYTESGYNLYKDKEYTIRKINESGETVGLKEIDGNWDLCRFILSEKKQNMNTFKIGDRVICNTTWVETAFKYASVYAGKEYTIKNIYNNGNIVLEETNECYDSSWFKLKEKLNMNKKIAIKVGNNQELSRIVQEFLFSKGYHWAGNNKTFDSSPVDSYLDLTCIVTEYQKDNLKLSFGSENFNREVSIPIYDASSQIGEIIKIFSEPPKPVIKIKNDAGQEYEADFKKNPGYVTFGCAKISLDVFSVLNNALDTKVAPDSKSVEQIKIGRGLFTPADIKSVVEHPDFGKANG